MRQEEAQLGRALDWVASLPLLGERELAGLLGVDERDARRLREELTRRGWVETVTPRSGGVHARPLAVVREGALSPLADRFGVDQVELRSAWPLGRAATLDRIARHEVVQSVNHLLAGLASQLRAAGDGRLETACSLPLSLPPDERWWPPGVEAHLKLRDGRECGTAFIAWDRAGAPDVHRRERVRQWFRPAARAHDACELYGPTILVVCAGDRERHLWAQAVLRERDRAGDTPVEVLLTTAAHMHRDGPLHVAWQTPGSADPCYLRHWLEWRATAPTRDDGSEPLPMLPATDPPLRARLAARQYSSREGTSHRERVAGLALTTDAPTRTVLEWTARHPWLTTEQLALLINDPPPAIERRLRGLVRRGVVRGVRVPDVDRDLWIATDEGLRVLAVADQVPASRYLKLGAVTIPREVEGRPGEVELPRAFLHELGVNGTFTALAGLARHRGGRLTVWRNEAESIHTFGEPRGYRVRPDGSGVLELDRGRFPFLLEYDRGTLSRPQIRAKLLAYGRYYGADAWWEHFDGPPVTLWVCANYRAAQRVAREVSMFGGALPALVIRESELHTAPDRWAVVRPAVPHRPHGAPGRRRRCGHSLRSHVPLGEAGPDASSTRYQ